MFDSRDHRRVERSQPPFGDMGRLVTAFNRQQHGWQLQTRRAATTNRGGTADHGDAPSGCSQPPGKGVSARLDRFSRQMQHLLHRDGRCRPAGDIFGERGLRMANVILSTRSARISGCVRSRSTSAVRPAMMPACGPPSSLSPLKHTRSTPAAMRRLNRSVRRAARRQTADVEPSQPLPRSSTTGMPTRAAGRTSSSSDGALGEAYDPEVGRMHAQEQRRSRA